MLVSDMPIWNNCPFRHLVADKYEIRVLNGVLSIWDPVEEVGLDMLWEDGRWSFPDQLDVFNERVLSPALSFFESNKSRAMTTEQMPKGMKRHAS